MTTTDELLTLFLITFSGIALGRISWRGFSLGTSGVIFTGLIAGHLGGHVPAAVGPLGLVVFVYCLGIDAGPRFFRVFFQQGKQLAFVGAVMIVAAMLAAWGFARVAGLPADLAAGILAGALTSTPALGAASEVLPANSDLAVGFGIAYPLGTLAVILFINIAPKIFNENERPADPADSAEHSGILRRLVHVMNPALSGKRLNEITLLERSQCQITRHLADGLLEPIHGEFLLATGQHLLLVGREADVNLLTDYLGDVSPHQGHSLETEEHRRRIVATSKNVVGKSLRELHLRSKYGITISRVYRHDVEFVPDADEVIHFGDALSAIGEPEQLEQFVTFAGHRERSFDETDLISLAFGLMIGTLLGQVRFELAGETISLGLAGGPLFAGLVMGHFGRIGPFVGHFPRAARLLLTETGLALFLAQAGVEAGSQFATVFKQHGVILCLGAISVASAPLIVGMLMTRFIVPLSGLQTLGAICGAMTSTPGLGALTSKIDSKIPATSYATVYPLALILMSLLAPALISLMS
ncbi:aspartate:alanine exchanger family transporter [Thalassoroseus pseudoceratinae]|uniref:aspartate:alanine exchanger family transporter n=1 Tax=Thalassoroseus pseudoceratinae TaxID=2713176 RepID=UPI00142482BD|nr:TrkA C-terminal domain-containing protein [Thalassoroseus pseudoceratinae]